MNKKERSDLLERCVALYLSGLPMLKVCDQLPISFSTLQKHLQSTGLSRSNRENSRRYQVDHNFFEDITNEIKAYWLGFMYADGFITQSKNQKMVGLSLATKDQKHLEKFSCDLSSNYPIRVYQGKCYNTPITYSRLLLTSEKLFYDLETKGVLQRKSLILRYPPRDIVPDHLERHFIRGYFDGDGCWSGNKEIVFKVCGTWEFLTKLAEKLEKPNLKLEQRRIGRESFQLNVGGNRQVYRIGNLMYRGATIYLDRKRSKFLSHYTDTEMCA
jgi:hypothetical protein